MNIGGLLCRILQLYFYVLLARVVLSFIPLASPSWRPPEWFRPILSFIYAITDPPVDFLRRFIPPLRAGAMAFDLAFLVWALLYQLVVFPLLCQLFLSVGI